MVMEELETDGGLGLKALASCRWGIMRLAVVGWLMGLGVVGGAYALASRRWAIGLCQRCWDGCR